MWFHRTREKRLEWQSSRLAPLATQFAAVVIIVHQWARQRRACRDLRLVSEPSRGGWVVWGETGFVGGKPVPSVVKAPSVTENGG